METKVKVNQLKTSKGSGWHKYTCNMYHTRSPMMVNSREADSFTEAHKAALEHIIDIQNLDSIDNDGSRAGKRSTIPSVTHLSRMKCGSKSAEPRSLATRQWSYYSIKGSKSKYVAAILVSSL